MSQLTNSPLNVQKLSLQELEQFTSIHNQFIPIRKNKFEQKEISSHGRNNKKIIMIGPILKKAFQILTNYGITNFDKSEFHLECHQRNCGFEKQKHQWSHWHTDDNGAVKYPVYTIIFYLRKDRTIKGGNLDYKIDKKVKTHIVESGDIVQFRGDLKHMPQSTDGFGCRDIVVLFIKRN